ncbi:MAG: hypothetical protein K2Q18_16820, partial [Bdellovibrionales bacterium]|nr:hypothetical protein [Bdellovibrionales bacterium]
MKLILILITIVFSSSAFGFPDLTRHGYSNCTACHLSPSGGGALTLYGRELSKELLSNSSEKGEQYFAYNAIPKLSKSDKILLSAYIRGLQVLRENDSANEARTILMQADAEVAYNEKKWAILGTIGRQEIRRGLESAGHLFSRRHYILARLDQNQNIRVGKFLKSFGLGDPNHYMFVRKDLNFSYDTESYNVEYSYLAEKWNFIATYVTDLKTDDYFRNTEKGIALNSSFTMFDKSKLGFNYYHGSDPREKRNILGAWGIGTFTKKLYLMSEVDWQLQKNVSTSSSMNGHVMSHRLSYEILKGVIPYISFDQKYLDYKNKQSELHSFGIGGHYYPRPHLELTGAIQREERIANNLKDNVYWIMGQFY